MDFGRVETSLLDEIDFKLPAEPVLNKKVLKGPAAKLIGHHHMVARVDLLEFRRRQLIGDGATHGNALTCQELAQHLVHGIGPLVDQCNFFDAKMAGGATDRQHGR